MRLSIQEGSENYVATIVRIQNMHDIEGADNIKRTVVFGNNIIVSKSVSVGDLMVYITADTKLSSEFCSQNNLFTDESLNREDKKGYVSPKQNRVKAVKLRGVISNGILLPINSIDLIGFDSTQLLEGDTFTHLEDTKVCEKYERPVKVRNSPGDRAKKTKMEDVIGKDQFRFHHQTEHLARNLFKVNPQDVIAITRKRHGSSLILANILVNKKLSVWSKFLKWLGADVSELEYGFVWSSGKPKSKKPKGVESDSNAWETPNQSYYTEDIWVKAYHLLKDSVEKGISIYGEITGQGIQGADYTYGKEYDIHIYRITQTNIDGNVYEFSWDAVKAYCDKYGLNYVEEYYVGTALGATSLNPYAEFNEEEFLAALSDKYLDKSYPDCKIDEGICLRKYSTNEIFKLKSPKFVLKESADLDIDKPDLESNN